MLIGLVLAIAVSHATNLAIYVLNLTYFRVEFKFFHICCLTSAEILSSFVIHLSWVQESRKSCSYSIYGFIYRFAIHKLCKRVIKEALSRRSVYRSMEAFSNLKFFNLWPSSVYPNMSCRTRYSKSCSTV